MQKRRSENQAEEEIASNVGSTFTVVLLPGYWDFKKGTVLL